ncbi:hypothetical protein BBB43_14175 [Bordetella parapertussis]|nr:hypothetical protein BBB43_14175 [Bordetella parapertussis]
MPGMPSRSPLLSGTSTTMSRARTCASLSACAKSLTGPHGMRAAPSRSSQYAVGLACSAAPTMASIRALAAKRAGCWR